MSDACLGCQYIETDPVTLHNGTVVCSSCEAWRHECEARWVLQMRDVRARREYLRKVEQGHRGTPPNPERAEALRATMMELWGKRGRD